MKEKRFYGSLHNHSDYSNLRLRDSINRVEELINYAIELGHEVIAFTEHESVSNAVKIEEYYDKIKEEHPNFKVIRGNEIYLCRNGLNAENFSKDNNDKYYHFILLAKDAIGHEQIRKLSSKAWERSYMTGKMRRVPTYYSDLIEIVGKNPGHIIASSSCMGGFIPTKLLEYRENNNENYYVKILKWIKKIQNIFGEDNFYLEMQPSELEEQIYVNKQLLRISKELNMKYIITTDSHYLKREDAKIHKAYLNSQDGDREVDSFYATTYMMGTEEIESFFSYLSKEEIEAAYDSILEIKNKCEDYTLKRPLKIPSLEWKIPKINHISDEWFERIPSLKTFYNSSFDGDVVLAKLLVEKLESDVRLQTKESYEAVEDNLQTTWKSSEVNKAHWSAYFLNLQKIVEVLWESGTLVGPARGSVTGFYLCYLLDIIQINPLWETTKLYPWRFLNPERVSVLDIDIDIEGGRRSKTLEALRRTYGHDNVANVVTFGKESSKQAIQTAARGLGIDIDISLYISSLIPADRGLIRTLNQCYYGDEENDFKPIVPFIKAMEEYPELWEVAKKIEGLICRVGEHAGGVIFTDEPFYKSTALMKVPNGDVVTQFDLRDSEKCSLIKMDLLSVEYLDKIHTTLNLLEEYDYITPELTLKETYEKYLGIYNIERKNPKMWEMVWNHEIQSLFQMEKQSGIKGISLVHPESIDDLAVLNSAIRLMAQGEEEEQPLDKYARFKRDINEWYKEMDECGLTKEEQKIIRSILDISYGMCVNQEQFMALVQIPECGGFNLSWADKLRKAVA